MGYENIFLGDAHIDKISNLNHIKINDIVITTTDQKEGKVYPFMALNDEGEQIITAGRATVRE